MSDLFDGTHNTNDDDEFDIERAKEKRDEGMDRVSGNNSTFTQQVIAIIRALPIGWEGMGEDIRIKATESGVEAPKSPNAWGAATNAAARAGLIEKTGKYLKPKAVKSHVSAKAQWRRCVRINQQEDAA